MSNRIIALDVPGLAPPGAPYSCATRLGDQVFVSGPLALDAEGHVVGAGDIAAQARAGRLVPPDRLMPFLRHAAGARG